MNSLIKDSETEAVLYGHVLLEIIKQTGQTQEVKVLSIPAEAYIAYLRTRWGHVPEVQEYLKQVEAGEGINPQEGKLLKAVDEAIDISESDVEGLTRIVEQEEGEDETD